MTREVKNVEESFFVIIHEALKAGDNDAVIALLEVVDAKTVVDRSKRTLLHLSAAYGNAFITNHLVNCECAIDAIDDSEISPLMLAIYYRHVEVIQILIDEGADLCSVNSMGRSPIFYAKLENDREIKNIIKSAINEKKAVKNKVMKLFMDTAWHQSMMDGIKDLYCNGQMDYRLRFFESEYYSPDECCSEGVPLIKAVFFRDAHQLQMNLKYDVSANIRDANGWTALHAAATIDSYYFEELSKLLQMLFDHGADVNVKDNKGATPLHVASTFCHSRVINSLLKRGANVNARDNEGRTPLHAAFMIYYKNHDSRNECVELLLKNGADAFAISPEGKSVLELSKTKLMEGRSIRDFILKNLALTTAQGKPVDEKHLQVLGRHSDMQAYYEQCEFELQIAKEDKIIDNVTLFDLLTKSAPILAVYVKNKDLRKAFKSLKFRRDYPIFAHRIQRRFIRAVNRMNMTNHAAVLLSEALPYFDPNHLVIHNVISYLTHNDLQILTDSDDFDDRYIM